MTSVIHGSSGRYRSRRSLVALLGIVATFAMSYGCYYDPEPLSNRPNESASQLNYYDVTIVSTGERVASGCIAVSYGTRFSGYPVFTVPKGEAYSARFYGGSIAGTLLTSEDYEAACARGPDDQVSASLDPRCARSVRTKDRLISADILDAEGEVVAPSESEKEDLIHGSSVRYTLISDESGIVQLDDGNPPCRQSFVFKEFSVVVTELN